MSPTLNLGSSTVRGSELAIRDLKKPFVCDSTLLVCYRVILSGQHGMFSLTLIGPLLVDRPPKSRASKCKERCWDWSPQVSQCIEPDKQDGVSKVKCHQLWFNYTFTLAFLPKYQLTPSPSDCQ